MATSNLRFRIIGDDDASGSFLRVAAAARLTKGSLDDLSESSFGLTKLVGGAGLIPVLAASAGVLGQLTASLGSAAGAGGIFGLSAFGVIQQMSKQQTVITATRKKLDGLDKGSQDYKDTLAQLQAQQSAFNESFGPAAKGFNDMKSAFAGFIDKTKGATTSVLGQGMELLASVLPKLVPVSNAAAGAVGKLLGDLSDWTKSSAFTDLLRWFKTSGTDAIVHWGRAIGNVLVGLGHILGDFAGPGDQAGRSLQRLTRHFAAWAGSKGVSDNIDRFLRYVHNEGPTISAVLSSLADIFPKLASSLGGLGSANLTAISMFLHLLAQMPQGMFDVVVTGMFGIAAGAKAVSIATGVAAIVTGLSGAVSALGDACILTRIELGLLWLQEKAGAAITTAMTGAQAALNFVLDANPIGLVVLAIAGLVGAFIIAYKKSETFRNLVDGAFTAIRNIVSNVIPAIVGFVRDHWGLLVAIIGGPLGAIVVFVIKHFDTIKSAVSDAVGFVVDQAHRFGEFASAVGDHISDAVKFFRDLHGKIADALSSIPGQLRTLGGQIIAGLVQGIQDRASSVMDAVQHLIDMIPAKIRHLMGIASPSKVTTELGQFIGDGLAEGMARSQPKVSAATQNLINHLKSQLSTLKSAFASLQSSIAGAFTGNLFQATNAQDFLADLTANRNGLAGLKAAFKTLEGWGLKPQFLSQLFQSGNAGLIMDLAKDKSAATQAGGLFGDITAMSNTLGNNVATDVYGNQIDQVQGQIQDQTQGRDLGTFTLRLVGDDGRELQRKLLRLKQLNGGVALGLA